MERRLHHTLRAMLGVVALLNLFQLGGCAYSSPDVEGRIVDARGEPVAGAVVVGIWQLESYGIHSHFMGDIIHVSESVSDAEGRYNIEGFDLRWLNPLATGTLDENDTDVLVVAEGYLPESARPDAAKHDLMVEAGGSNESVPSLHVRDITLRKRRIDNWNTAHYWSNFIGNVVADMNCDDVHQLPMMMTLFERIEPQYNQYLDGSVHGWRYRGIVKKCTENAGK